MTYSADVFYSICMSLSSFYVALHDDLMSSFGLFFRAFMTLYLVYTGYAFYKKSDNWRDILEMFCLVAIVYSFVLESQAYFSFVIEPFFEMLEDLLAFLLGIIAKVGGGDHFDGVSSLTGLFVGLDKMLLDFWAACTDLTPSGWDMFHPLIIHEFVAIGILLFAYGTMYTLFCVMFIISYFMMWLLFYVGGIMMLFGCIKETRGWFFGWMRMLVNQFLVAVFTALVVAVCYGGIFSAVSKMASFDESSFVLSGEFIQVLIWCALCIAVTLKVPDIAAGLSGSTAGSTSGIAGGISTAGGMATTIGGMASMAPVGAFGAAASFIGHKTGILPTGMSATEALKNKLGIKN